MKINKLLMTAALSLLVAACGGNNPASAEKSAASTVANNNQSVVRVALEPGYPPYIEQNVGGKMTGFDVDILEAIAQKSGFQLEFIPVPWDVLFQQLDNNQADLLAGGIALTEERKTKMDFSDPYNDVGDVLLVYKNSPIQNIEQARGKKIAYHKGTNSEDALRKIQGANELDPALGAPTAWGAIKLLVDGNGKGVDGVLGTESELGYYSKKYPDLNFRMIHAPSNAAATADAFAVKKGNKELLDKINKGLAAIKADGTYDKIKEKWLGDYK